MEIKQGFLPNPNNYRKGRAANIEYIVIHYTANKGDTALNNVKYFANNVVKASAHFFVDENNAYTSVPVSDVAWHCGGGLQGSGGHDWHGICTNTNSIGIEMCIWDKQGNIRQGTIDKTIELTKYLMEKYNIPSKNVIRHYDVTGKMCPQPFVKNGDLWKSFKKNIELAVNPIQTENQEEIDMNEINRINEILELVGNDIAELKQLIKTNADENIRQNEIINLVGQDIAALKEKVGM